MNIAKVTGKDQARLLGLAVILMVIFTSCGTTRPYVYMQGGFDTTAYSSIPTFDPKIKIGDLLNIIVFSDNPEASAIYNQGGSVGLQLPTSPSSAGGAISGGGTGGTRSGAGGAQSLGYLVDERGNITFRDLGVIHVDGYTRGQLTDTLNTRLAEYLSHPYCNVRFLNYKFRMLGELTKPGEYSIPDEKINILEAIALAGDLTQYGRRDNVLIIREDSGKRVFARMDLTKPEIMKSKFFYLQQNDLVVVEQNRKKSVANDQVTLRNISIISSIVTLSALLYSLFRK